LSEPILQIKELSKSFRKRVAVDQLSFSVHPGEVFGFLGPNGAGKSTTIRMILSLIKPEQGDVNIFGKSVKRLHNKALHSVGALIEDADFYENMTAQRNLEILARLQNIRSIRIDEVLELVELSDRADDKVKGYSHGMKQRLGIAQALLNEPKLLILDEPTTGLDPRGMKEIRELVRRLSGEGMTIFLSSHLLHEVEQVCTSLAIINKGKLIKSGTLDDLFYKTELFTTEFHVSPMEKAKQVLSNQSQVEEVIVADSALKVKAPNDQLGILNKILVDNGIEVSAIIPRASLEDYFLSLTESGEA